jgi:hypothetical protein
MCIEREINIDRINTFNAAFAFVINMKSIRFSLNFDIN